MHQLEQKFNCCILTRERDGRQEYGTKPRIGRFAEPMAQDFKARSGMSARNSQRSFARRVITRGQEARDPGNRPGAFDAQDSAVAGPENLRFIMPLVQLSGGAITRTK